MALKDGTDDGRLNAKMLTKLRGAPPAALVDLFQDETWNAIFRLFAEEEFSVENWDFLNAVVKFESEPNPLYAAKVYYEYVRETRPPRSIYPTECDSSWCHGSPRTSLMSPSGSSGTGQPHPATTRLPSRSSWTPSHYSREMNHPWRSLLPGRSITSTWTETPLYGSP